MIAAPLVLGAVQETASLVLPDAVTVGFAGASGTSTTCTFAVALPLPPSPVQVTVTLKLPTALGVKAADPDGSVEPMPGEPEQLVAFVDDQDRSALPPSLTSFTSKEAVTVGAGGGAGTPLTKTLARVAAE